MNPSNIDNFKGGLADLEMDSLWPLRLRRIDTIEGMPQMAASSSFRIGEEVLKTEGSRIFPLREEGKYSFSGEIGEVVAITRSPSITVTTVKFPNDNVQHDFINGSGELLPVAKLGEITTEERKGGFTKSTLVPTEEVAVLLKDAYKHFEDDKDFDHRYPEFRVTFTLLLLEVTALLTSYQNFTATTRLGIPRSLLGTYIDTVNSAENELQTAIFETLSTNSEGKKGDIKEGNVIVYRDSQEGSSKTEVRAWLYTETAVVETKDPTAQIGKCIFREIDIYNGEIINDSVYFTDEQAPLKEYEKGEYCVYSDLKSLKEALWRANNAKEGVRMKLSRLIMDVLSRGK